MDLSNLNAPLCCATVLGQGLPPLVVSTYQPFPDERLKKKKKKKNIHRPRLHDVTVNSLQIGPNREGSLVVEVWAWKMHAMTCFLECWV